MINMFSDKCKIEDFLKIVIYTDYKNTSIEDLM